jgi:hypothetical protein
MSHKKCPVFFLGKAGHVLEEKRILFALFSNKVVSIRQYFFLIQRGFEFIDLVTKKLSEGKTNK